MAPASLHFFFQGRDGACIVTFLSGTFNCECPHSQGKKIKTRTKQCNNGTTIMGSKHDLSHCTTTWNIHDTALVIWIHGSYYIYSVLVETWVLVYSRSGHYTALHWSYRSESQHFTGVRCPSLFPWRAPYSTSLELRVRPISVAETTQHFTDDDMICRPFRAQSVCTHHMARTQPH